MMSCIPEGFKAMVPAILILSFAWTLKAMTDSLGAKYFVRDFVYSNASQVQMFLPAIVFLIGCLLAFATGTSWGTFGMLIPIVQSVFPMDNPLSVVCISACMPARSAGTTVLPSPTPPLWPRRGLSVITSIMSQRSCPMPSQWRR